MNETSIGFMDRLRGRWPEWTAIGLFAAVVGYAIPFHEPWTDEAQAWQLARSLSLTQLFRTYIRYEGTPGLWHFLLWVMIRLHISYAGLHWMCGAIAVGSASLLVLYSPFPRYLKLTLPFTFFLLFQYAIIARSYVLVPPLLFMTAMGWRKRPVLVAVALGLMANTSLHAAAISGGLAIVYLIDWLMDRDKRIGRRSDLLICGLILACSYGFALWTAWPSGDMRYISVIHDHAPRLLSSVLAWLLLPMCEPVALSVPFWIAIVLLLLSRRRVHYLIPVITFLAFCCVSFASYWHFGMLVPLLICVLWISWPQQAGSRSKLESIGRAALAYMIFTQVTWAVYSIYYDRSNAYSPDLATANFLKPYVDSGTAIAITNIDDVSDHDAIATGILPYFSGSIFVNQSDPFYWWGRQNATEQRFTALLPSHPEMIVAESQPAQPKAGFDIQNPAIRHLESYGYRLTHVFCGTLTFRTEPFLVNCHLIFEYSGENK